LLTLPLRGQWITHHVLHLLELADVEEEVGVGHGLLELHGAGRVEVGRGGLGQLQRDR